MKKLTSQEAVKILQQYLKTELMKHRWFHKIKPHIKAIVLYGSTAKGTNKPESDIDSLIFVPLEIEERYTTGEYFYTYKGREINIVLRSIERLRALSHEKSNPFEAEVFRKCTVLYESDTEVKTLIEKIKAQKKL